MRRAFLKILFSVQLVFFLLMSFCSLATIQNIVACGSVAKFRLGLAGLVLVVAFFGCLAWLILKLHLYEKQWAWLLTFGIIFALQLAAFFILKPLPIWDCRSVLEEAALMSSNGFNMSAQSGYFERYSNNYPFTIMLAAFYWVLARLNVQNLWFCSVIANCIALDAATYIGVYLLSRVHSKRAAMVFLLITAICPLTYIFTWLVYTNTFSILMMMLILLCVYKLLNVGNELRAGLIWSAVLGVTLVFSYLIRATAIFVFIAAVMCFVLCRQKSKLGIKYRNLLLYLLVLVVSATLSNGVYKAVEAQCVDDSLREKNFPLTHWLMMGQNSERGGLFYYEDELYTESFSGKEAKTEANLKVLKERIVQNKDAGLAGFLLTKLSHNWSELGQIVREYSGANQHYGWLYSLLAGENSIIFTGWVQMFYAALYLVSAWSVLRLIRLEDLPFWVSVLALTIFGAVVFYLIWEVSRIYNICFVPLLAMLASIAPAERLPEWEFRDLPKTFLPILMALLLMGQFASSPNVEKMMVNKVFMYDDYSVFSLFRRQGLEEQLDTIARDKTVIQDGFRVGKGETDSTLRLYVDIKDSAEGCDYTFSLYDENGTLLHQQLLDYRNLEWDGEDLYIYQIIFDKEIGEGNYSFTIEAVQDGREDGLGFAYSWHRIGADQNPGGDLRLSGKLLENCELLFDVA